MAKAKTDAWLTWPLEIGRTVRFVAMCGLIYGVVDRVTWMIVKLTDKPPWLEFALAVLGLFTAGSGVAVWRLRVRWRQADAERAIQPPPLQASPPETTRKEGEQP